jgi:RHS repeat-associated protein
MLLTEEGYVDLSNSTYHYYLKDHQGNNRVVIKDDGTVSETNHYYPFGSVFASTGNVQPYKYNGKELDTKKGLKWYDYGARHYDASLGRWFVVDPLVEKYYGLSPYTYCYNNPIRFVDPNGQDGKDVVVGYAIGFITNLLPNTGFLRDAYTPTDVSDYNNALRGMDNASIAIGQVMIAGGGGAMIAGETMTATGVALTVGSAESSSAVSVPTAISGVVVTEAGAITIASGVNMMNNAQQNKEAGYDRGKKGADSSGNKKSSQYSKEPPGELIKLKNGQGWKDPKTGDIWKRDMKHKDHYDVTNPKTGKKVKEVDFDGNQIWPDGPKNKNKR